MLLAVMKSAAIDPQWRQKQNMLLESQAQQNNADIAGVNQSGEKYQTNSANGNPNGRLSGNWTPMENVS